MVMGSSTNFLLIGPELKRKREKKCMADEQFHQANNKSDYCIIILHIFSNIGLPHLLDMSQIHALSNAAPTLAAISLYVVLFQAQARVLGMSER